MLIHLAEDGQAFASIPPDIPRDSGPTLLSALEELAAEVAQQRRQYFWRRVDNVYSTATLSEATETVTRERIYEATRFVRRLNVILDEFENAPPDSR